MNELYECPNCGSNLRFSIERQKLWCEACGTEKSPYEVVKDRDAEERSDYDVTIFTCPQCGGEIVSEDTEAAAFCSFCGGSTILDSRISSARKPEYIIPFGKTKADCAESFRKLTRRALFTPDEIKDTSNIESFRGIYIPYWNYESGLKDHVRADVRKTFSRYKGDFEYIDHYDFETDVDCLFNGVTYDASGAFSDKLSNAIAPFDTTKVMPFTPSFLSGFYADTNDVDRSVYEDDVKELVTESCTDTLMHDSSLSGYTAEQDKIRACLHPDIKKSVLTMMPVWFMSIRHKEAGQPDRVSYIAVNGQTGEAAGDLPISLRKYLTASVILAAVLFALMYFTVSLGRVSSLIASCALLVISAIIYAVQEHSITKWETGEDDKGMMASGILAKNTGEDRGNRKEAAEQKAQYTYNTFDTIKTIAGIAVTALLVWLMPIYDMLFYGAAIVQMAFMFHFFYKLMKRYNMLTTRRLPQFRRTGGDDSAKDLKRQLERAAEAK